MLENKIKEYAEILYELVGCRHYSRVDFILDKNNDIYILEINTLPGLTDTSLFPKAYDEEFKDFKLLIRSPLIASSEKLKVLKKILIV